MRIFSRCPRILTLGGAALLAVVSIGGATSAEELTGTLKKVSETGSITLGYREASAPFSFLDENKRPTGYAIELCLKIVDEVKTALGRPDVAVKYAPVTPKTRISMVVDGNVDLECGTTTNTLARQQQVDFSPIYFTTGTRLLTWKASKVSEIENLSGKMIAVVGGSTNEKAVRGLIDKGQLSGVQLLVMNDYAQGIAALETKKVDAFATDDIVLYGLLAKSDKKQDLEVVGRYLSYDPYGIMLRRDDSAFRLVVNRALARVFRSGEILGIYARWFDPISVPISGTLKAAFELQAIPE
ncbi:MAG: amino acid ABC transporter substrate-binding protein [Mesorhizobium sp.]|nr:MAG: amino acid ABC transporter substrate-binding protein [Mesorhizobium sp.]